MAKHYRMDRIGAILFERSPRARRINITVRPFKGVRVAVPRGITFAQARSFARASRSWIKKQLLKTARIEKEHGPLFDLFQGIEIERARDVLTRRLDVLARIHGYHYNRVYIRNQKTRWGSCSAKNNISLNIKLTRLPSHLMDYVILHELVHTRIKNHSPRFYNELDRLVRDRQALDAALKVYGIGLL